MDYEVLGPIGDEKRLEVLFGSDDFEAVMEFAEGYDGACLPAIWRAGPDVDTQLERVRGFRERRHDLLAAVWPVMIA